ncbi:MAG: saccharopine dehydrogenase NADP-binding domain-containing protein [Halioglobus sp.]
MSKEWDIVVYGATGFTGRLVCEYLSNQYGTEGEVSWAMAGRSQQKLEQVRGELGISDAIPLVVADAADAASIDAMVAKSKVVLTTVGPYQLYGSDLVKACAAAGTDYVDLCGEPAWMHEMIAAHGDAAKASGARIVFSCGFDSIPFDLGVLYLQQLAAKENQAPLNRVKGRVRTMKGTMSGGTLASFKATMAAAGKNPELIKVLMDSFALTEGYIGPEQPSGLAPIFEDDLGSWSAPFVMATINTKNIHRSNFLLGHSYGEDFIYDEMLLTGPGDQGEAIAKGVAADKSMAESTLQPGEGPSQEERDNGSYDVMFSGSNDSGYNVVASVQGDKDPGYGSTSKMIAEAAVCLALHPELAAGGIWTPAAALGAPLIDRLQSNAGLTFTKEG